MNPTQLIGRMLGYANVDSIEPLKPSLAAPCAQDHPLLVILGCVVLVSIGVLVYSRFQPQRARGVRIALAISRALLLSLLLLFLAEPVLVVRIISHPRPLLWLLFDGTDSMAIQD